MINFQNVTKETFFNDYWQKKPLLIKNALPDFVAPLDQDELAGLAMEEEVESRLVLEMPDKTPQWQLKQGPFSGETLSSLPQTHWTLLVQGVDRFIPEVSQLLSSFDFLPQWRVDDIMISIAAMHGGVGPHYDNYDVFLYQASGQRKWSLTSKNCNEANALKDCDLRIMADFETEQEIILNEGDMLYVPPHIGHHGISLSENSIGYSFGYRSYQSQELWDSFADHLSEIKSTTHLYKDPNFNQLNSTSEISSGSFQNAKLLMQALLNDEDKLQQWFARFATQLDQQGVQLLSEPLTDEEVLELPIFINHLKQIAHIDRDLNARIAYYFNKNKLNLSINGEPFDTQEATDELVTLIACNRRVTSKELQPHLNNCNNQEFLYELWKLQFFSF